MKKLSHWITKTNNIDIDTGELLEKEDVAKNYIVLKTEKQVTINKTNTIGYVTITKQCRRKPEQRRFEF